MLWEYISCRIGGSRKLDLIMGFMNSSCLNDIVLVDKYPPPTAFLARYNGFFYVISFVVADDSKAVSRC